MAFCFLFIQHSGLSEEISSFQSHFAALISEVTARCESYFPHCFFPPTSCRVPPFFHFADSPSSIYIFLTRRASSFSRFLFLIFHYFSFVSVLRVPFSLGHDSIYLAGRFAFVRVIGFFILLRKCYISIFFGGKIKTYIRKNI